MGTMYPVSIPDYVARDPYRSAEIAVFELLKKHLPDKYHCYYSRPWLGLTPEGEEREGEADFVVAHPDKGFLVIEVKGGAVSRQEGTEEWFSRNRLGITNNIKDPVQQASKSKHVLLAKLKEQGGWKVRFVTARHGVILPDCSGPRHALGANMPLWIFAFAEELENISGWVESRLGQNEGQNDFSGRGLGQDGIAALQRLLASGFELRPNLARALREDRREVERLTREQYDLLNSLDESPQMTLAGGAGTGKTLLALEKATRLAEQGKRVLVTCYNSALGEHLARLTAKIPNLVAANFHSICGSLAQEAKIQIPASNEKARLYAEDLPNALLEAVTRQESLKFDAVIVDEGQDFAADWLTTLRLCLKNSEAGHFYVFYDDNQKVYQRPSNWYLELPASKFWLTKNLRNTKAIHLCSKPWYQGRATRSAGPDGVPVEWITIRSKSELVPAVKGALTDIVVRQQIPAGDIAILTGGRTEVHPLMERGAISGIPFSQAGTAADGRLVFDTIRRFKGLERAVVLLVDIDEITGPELAYIGLTRASILMKVFGTRAAIADIRDGQFRAVD